MTSLTEGTLETRRDSSAISQETGRPRRARVVRLPIHEAPSLHRRRQPPRRTPQAFTVGARRARLRKTDTRWQSPTYIATPFYDSHSLRSHLTIVDALPPTITSFSGTGASRSRLGPLDGRHSRMPSSVRIGIAPNNPRDWWPGYVGGCQDDITLLNLQRRPTSPGPGRTNMDPRHTLPDMDRLPAVRPPQNALVSTYLPSPPHRSMRT